MALSRASNNLPLYFVTTWLHSRVHTLSAVVHESQVPRRVGSALYNTYDMFELRTRLPQAPNALSRFPTLALLLALSSRLCAICALPVSVPPRPPTPCTARAQASARPLARGSTSI